MNNRLYGNLIFELSQEGRSGYLFPRTSLAAMRFRPLCVARKMLRYLSVMR